MEKLRWGICQYKVWEYLNDILSYEKLYDTRNTSWIELIDKQTVFQADPEIS